MNVTWRPQRYRTIKLFRTVFITVVSFCILLPRPHCIFALMVMHARKPQRISDGYFEKNQAHPYQKYNNKSDRRGNEYINVDGRYPQLVSPNGNVGHGGHGHASHSHHYYAHCDDRQYARGAWSVHKPCEKERDRDYKPSRDKYPDSVNKRGKDSERERSNHERSEPEKKNRTSGVNSSVNKSNKYEKRSATTNVTIPPGSEWSEHISSSGKRYYYNAISEVSQWEKPREWDLRRTSSKESTTYPSRTNHEKRSDSRTGKYSEKYPEKYSEKYPEKYPEKYTEKPNKRTNSQRYWNSNSGRDEDGHDRKRLKRSSVAHEECPLATDMEISPDRSPVSESSYRVPREITAIGRCAPESSSKVPPVVVIDNSTQQGGSLLAAALPRIVAAPVPNNGKAGSPVLEVSPGSNTPHRDAGPPTPTHSENMDPHAPPIHLENALPRRMESLGSYSSVVGNSSLQVPPILTPSLMNSVRTDLMGHVTNWPADILEKQANKYLDEAYHLGCLQCTRVSSELKCSRSLVRHTEIQATLQEQKIMYLRQQITRLEELRSQNMFMSDD